MVPESYLPYSLRGEAVLPHFLREDDHPWLRTLLEECDRFVGRPQRELDERLAEPLLCASPPGKRRLAIHVLGRLSRTERRLPVPAKRVRGEVFGEAARSRVPRDVVLATVAGRFGLTPAELANALFADLPGERLVISPEEPLSPGELALRANLALAQALIFRATAVTIEALGNARALVRHAKLCGLICRVVARGEASDALLELSGPLSLFRRTLLYGRALSSLVPFLAWCRRFRLYAECLLRGRQVSLELRSGDPLFPAAEPRMYDSKLEEGFARAFRRIAPDWDVVREPEPVDAGTSLVFPDFALQHRLDRKRRWLLEIVGFWTPDYLARKLALYRTAGLSNLILCIDDARQCSEGDLPAGTPVLRFRRRVDARAVLRLIDASMSRCRAR